MQQLEIRVYRESDEDNVVALWRQCGLVVPWNDPVKDIRVSAWLKTETLGTDKWLPCAAGESKLTQTRRSRSPTTSPVVALPSWSGVLGPFLW